MSALTPNLSVRGILMPYSFVPFVRSRPRPSSPPSPAEMWERLQAWNPALYEHHLYLLTLSYEAELAARRERLEDP
jgi:hypothetical protein